MNVLRITILCLCLQAGAYAQKVTITVDHHGSAKAALLSLSGEKSALVDSIMSTAEGTYSFSFGPEEPPGIYRLALDRARGIDFVLDGEDAELRTDARAPAESLKVLRSEKNRRYSDFRRLNRQYRMKSEILQLVLARYPHDDPFFATAAATATELQNGYLDFVRASEREWPDAFVARYIRSAQLPVVDLTLAPEHQLTFLKAHALDRVDFTDEGLIRSDLFTSKSIEYLTYFRNPQLPKELLAREFNSAVDSILNRAKVNQKVYRHITEYLIDGFKQFGFEECINYILDNYVIKDDLCLEGSGNTLQRMIDQKKLLPVGAVAPEILLPDTSGSPVSLRGLKGGKTLVVFYMTTCPHCQSMIPQLKALLAGGDRATEVLAVCLDATLDAWMEFVRSNALSWRNVIDVQGWGGKAAAEYQIYATPTMFLLDREKKIVGKPATLAELKAMF